MKFHLEVSEYCKQDVIHSAKWYALRQQGLDERFILEFEATIGLIAQNPEIGALANERTRRFSMSIFPYTLYYQTFTDRIQVIACLHGVRKPSDIVLEPENRK